MLRQEHNQQWGTTYQPLDRLVANFMSRDGRYVFDHDCYLCLTNRFHTWEQHDAALMVKREELALQSDRTYEIEQLTQTPLIKPEGSQWSDEQWKIGGLMNDIRDFSGTAEIVQDTNREMSQHLLDLALRRIESLRIIIENQHQSVNGNVS